MAASGGAGDLALKAEVARSAARSRIIADPSIISHFKDDQELFDLFCR